MRGLTDLQRGNRYFVAKNYPAAVKCLLRHVRKHPEDAADAYTRVGDCYLRSNVLPKPKAVAGGNLTLVSQGDRPNAERYYRLALQQNPDHIGALKGLAHVLPDTAVERCQTLESLARIQPGTIVLIDLGDYYREQQRDLPRAYQIYLQAQQHAPKEQPAYDRLRDICRDLGRSDEAKRWADEWRSVYAKKRVH
jgi:tetratricopeptide (TPR) repeat protein